MIVISTYNRPGKLKQIIQHLQKTTDHELFIVDDCSNYDVGMFGVEYYSAPFNGGKQNYWKQFDVALQRCKQSNDETFVFMPDDFMDLDIERINKWIDCFNGQHPFLVNLINDGRLECFQPFTPKRVQINNENAHRVGFTDCGFFCNRQTLELLDFKMNEIFEHRWNVNPTMSSGVGEQLSIRLFPKCEMFVPDVSFSKHGNHESKMHPIERINTPLISRH